MADIIDATFDALASHDDDVATVLIDMPDGRVLRFRLGHIGYSEWNEIGAAVPSPKAPTKVLAGKRVTDAENPAYARARLEADDERMLRRLARALERGGMPLPGETLEAKAAALRDRDTGLVNALLNHVMTMGLGVRTRFEEQATFPDGLSGAGAADAAGLEADAG